MSFVNRIRRQRVSILEEHHPYYQELVSLSPTNSEHQPFESMKHLFMYAACLGAHFNVRRPLEGKNVGIFSGEQFDPEVDVPILAALAFGEAERVDVLANATEVTQIVQELANGGIVIVRQELEARSAISPLMRLKDMVTENIGTEGSISLHR